MLSYLSKLVNWAKRNADDIFLTAGIVLVALVSFGIGQLVSFSGNNSAIIIQQPVDFPANSSAAAEQSLPKSEIKTTGQKTFVGSVNSNKYHWPSCPSAKKIAPQNQIWFDSEEMAQAAGYVRCANFDQYAPIAR